jgi:hypothetical protein
MIDNTVCSDDVTPVSVAHGSYRLNRRPTRNPCARKYRVSIRHRSAAQARVEDALHVVKRLCRAFCLTSTILTGQDIVVHWLP